VFGWELIGLWGGYLRIVDYGSFCGLDGPGECG